MSPRAGWDAKPDAAFMSIDAAQLGSAGVWPRSASRRLTRLGKLVLTGLALCVWAGSAAVARAETPPELSLDAYRAQMARAQAMLSEASAALQPYYAEDEPWRMDDVLPPAAREELRRLLPERCTVATPTGFCAVNNQALRSALDELCESASAAEMRERLRALDAQLVIIQQHLGAPPEGAAADIRAILAREAFQPIKKTKTPFQVLREWLAEILENLLRKLPRPVKAIGESGLWSNQWMQLGLWMAIVILLIGAAVWLVGRHRRQQAAADDGARVILGEPVPLDMDADELLAQARAAAESGDWRQAARKIYIALLHELDKREVVRLNPAWTNREYLAAVRAQTRIYLPLRDLTDRFDVLWYGRQDGSREDYERFLARYREALAALPATA
ncbi:MAG: hypothetical protein CFK52_10995 [Chloracidobacterium sp. CP2_5A]|nr:MAG: hypothetical protein CFK52_10995 [Chloracidobacterium sp. CP2_5A]